jgi:hypothetical protein
VTNRLLHLRPLCLATLTVQLLRLHPILHLRPLRSATSTVQLHRLFNYIDSMSILFLSFSEVNLMIGCLLIYQTYHELCVIYNFLVLVWIWLHACLLYDPRLGLVKLILYHVNFVTM